MEVTMKLAIKAYSKLTGQCEKHIIQKCLNGDEVVVGNIQKLMFAVS